MVTTEREMACMCSGRIGLRPVDSLLDEIGLTSGVEVLSGCPISTVLRSLSIATLSMNIIINQ